MVASHAGRPTSQGWYLYATTIYEDGVGNTAKVRMTAPHQTIKTTLYSNAVPSTHMAMHCTDAPSRAMQRARGPLQQDSSENTNLPGELAHSPAKCWLPASTSLKCYQTAEIIEEFCFSKLKYDLF